MYVHSGPAGETSSVQHRHLARPVQAHKEGASRVTTNQVGGRRSSFYLVFVIRDIYQTAGRIYNAETLRHEGSESTNRTWWNARKGPDDNVLTQMSIISRGKGGEDKRRNMRLDENWRAKSVTTVAA